LSLKLKLRFGEKMSKYTHDEIVIAVDEVLITIITQIVEEMLKSQDLSENLLFYNKIKLLNEFLQKGQKESIRRVNRPPVKGGERPDLELFGGLIVIEVESSEETLEHGEKQLQNYIEKYYSDIAIYGIVTTGLTWRIYRVHKYEKEKVKLERIAVLRGDENEYNRSIVLAVKKSHIYQYLYNLLKSTLIESKAYKLEPSPENVRRILYPVLMYVDDLIGLMDEYKIHNKALYKSYREMLFRIYAKLTDVEINKLFATHTLLQMIVNVVFTGALGKLEKAAIEPIKACSGEELEFDITIPHLMWWRELAFTDREFRLRVEELCKDIYYRALLFDWNTPIVEDVFSHIYEDFIERALRYKIGEYYTPWWLIEFIIYQMKQKFKVDYKDKIVLDPACGSGRFLVKAFYEKVKESGEDPNKAYYEVIGLDILPLATTIARVELMIAYKRATGEIPLGTPLIFWGDFLANEIGLGAEIIDELKNILNGLTVYMWGLSELSKLKKHELVIFLARLELLLTQILKGLTYTFTSPEEVFKVINETINRLKAIEPIDVVDKAATSLIIKILSDEKLVLEILKLITRYGNEIWAIPIVSDLFVKYLSKIKPDIVLTNPPWLKLSELPKSKWGEALREYIKKNIIEKYKEKIPGISKTGMSGDISSIFLEVILKILEKEGYIGIVMPAEQSYTPKSPHGAGKLLTYAVLSKYSAEGSIIYVGDAFKHGRHASVLILRVRK